MHYDGIRKKNKGTQQINGMHNNESVLAPAPSIQTRTNNQMGSLMMIVMMTETTNDDRFVSFYSAASTENSNLNLNLNDGECVRHFSFRHICIKSLFSLKWVWLCEWLSYITWNFEYIVIFLGFVFEKQTQLWFPFSCWKFSKLKNNQEFWKGPLYFS